VNGPGANGTSGAGLANVRARLTALYGEHGNLVLQGNAAGGATAKLTLSGKEQAP